eukprot:664227-Rhodomonas_salina.1
MSVLAKVVQYPHWQLTCQCQYLQSKVSAQTRGLGALGQHDRHADAHHRKIKGQSHFWYKVSLYGKGAFLCLPVSVRTLKTIQKWSDLEHVVDL